MLGEFSGCNYFSFYSSEIPSGNSLTFTSKSCLDIGIIIFQFLGFFMALFQIFIIFASSFAFIPVCQTGFGYYSQFSLFKVLFFQYFQLLTFIYLPENMIYLGYLMSFFSSLFAVMMLIHEHPFHAIFQGCFVIGFVSVRGMWSLLLFMYLSVVKSILSKANPYIGVKSFFSSNIDIIGGIMLFLTLFISLIVGIIIFGIAYGKYFFLLKKFKKLLQKMIISNDTSNNLVPVVSKKHGISFIRLLNCVCLKIFSNKEMSNKDVSYAIKLSSLDKRLIIGTGFEELAKERVEDEIKRENSNEMLFTLIIFLLTRKRLAKSKKMKPQPLVGELLIIYLKMADEKSNDFFSKMRLMAIRSLLIFILISFLSKI